MDKGKSSLQEYEAVRKPSPVVYVAALSAMMGAMCMGAVLGWSAPAIPDMEREDSQPRIDPKNESDLQTKSWIGSCVTLGALVGGLLCGTIMQTFGRKKSLIALGIPFTVGWILICVAKSFIVVIIGRTLTGFSCGLVCGFAPTYAIELSTPKIRGLLGAGFQVFVVIGILYVDILSEAIDRWYMLAIVGLVPGVIMSVAMVFMPESPQWLMNKYGRCSQVVDALKRLRTSDSNIEAELKEIEDRADRAKQEAGFSMRQFGRRDVYMPFIIAMCLMFFQQFSGINAVLFYTTDIFLDAGSSMNAKLATIVVNASMVGATIAGSLVIDRLGRKILLIVSGIGHVISLGVLGYYYLRNKPEDATADALNATITIATTIATTTESTASKSDYGWVPIVCLVVFVIVFSLGYGPIPWMIVGEITPSSVIGVISSIATAFNWTCAFSITKEFEDVEKALTRHWTFWMFAIFSALSVVFTFFFVPETKGKSIEDIQREFLSGRRYSDASTDSYQKYAVNKPVTTI